MVIGHLKGSRYFRSYSLQVGLIDSNEMKSSVDCIWEDKCIWGPQGTGGLLLSAGDSGFRRQQLSGQARPSLLSPLAHLGPSLSSSNN